MALHQKATLPKTKGTLTNGTLLLLKSLAAFCMLGNVTASPTPTCGCFGTRPSNKHMMSRSAC